MMIASSPMPKASAFLRQWNTLLAVAAHGDGRGVDELAKEHAVGDKTVRRDLVALRKAGFPLEETVGRRGRKVWKLAAADLPPVDLNWQEAMSLYLARRFLDPLAGTYVTEAADRAMAKIRARLGPQALKYLDRMAGAIHLTNVGAAHYGEKAALLDRLDQAIAECRVTLLEYQSERTTEPVTREVHPYAWVFHRSSVYLAAFAAEHREVRLYKADRIHDLQFSDLRFPRPADFDAAAYLAGSFGVFRGTNGRPLQVRVRFLPPVAQYVSEKQWHASQTLTRERDGSLIAEFRLSATEEIKRWLLSFGRNAEVLEPTSLVAEMREELAAMNDLYALAPRVRPSRQRQRIRKKG
jgi:predicted DNA-binding transcriptional regulator YafY